MVKRAANIVMASLAVSSIKSYNRIWAEFSNYVLNNHLAVSVKFATPGDVLLFLTSMEMRGLAASTILTKFSAISYFFKLLSLGDLSQNYILSRFLMGIKKSVLKVDDRIPVSLPLLHRMVDVLSTMGISEYNTVMLQSLLVLCFHGFLRPGEISGSLHNLLFHMCTIFIDSIQLNFVTYKHHKGLSSKILIPATSSKYCPRKLLIKYLSYRGVKKGYLYCYTNGKPVSYDYLSKTIKSIVSVLNINGVLTPHSFRIGAATWAARQGVSIEDITRMGRWSSDAVKGYVRIPQVKLQLFE